MWMRYNREQSNRYERLKEALLYVIRDKISGEVIALVFDAEKISIRDIEDIITRLETGLPIELAKLIEPSKRWAFRFDKRNKTIIVYNQNKLEVL